MGGTPRSAAKGVVNGGITPFTALRDVPPQKINLRDVPPKRSTYFAATP